MCNASDKDGLITWKDFELVVQGYEDLGGVTGEQLQHIKSLLMELCDSAMLVDDTKLFTHEEFKKCSEHAKPCTTAQ